MNPFRLGDLVDQCGREPRVKLKAGRAAVGAAAVGPALFADFLEIGVHQAGAGG